MSRSEGRRLTHRLEETSEALLDFRGVASIGRAFADEVFRVFRAAFPDTTLITLNASPEVRATIRLALGTDAPAAGAAAAAATGVTSATTAGAGASAGVRTKDERPARS